MGGVGRDWSVFVTWWRDISRAGRIKLDVFRGMGAMQFTGGWERKKGAPDKLAAQLPGQLPDRVPDQFPRQIAAQFPAS